MAGLDIAHRVVELRNDDIATRIAIHTGPVVVGQMGSGTLRIDDAIVGLTPNVAARLQNYAEPNTVIISETTAELVRGYFELQSLGSLALKGVDSATEAFRPVASLEHISRFDIAEATGLTPLAGRKDDLAALADHWSSAVGGTPCTVLLHGDAGIGKTRLMHEFRRDRSRGEFDLIELRCSALHANRPLQPVLDQLRSRLGLDGDSGDPEKSVKRLRALIERAGLQAQPTLALVGAMFDLPAQRDEPQLAEGVEFRRNLMIKALRELIVSGATGRPLLVVVEDLHWADPTTLTLVGSLTASVTPRPVMVLCTARSELELDGSGRSDVQMFGLQRLDDAAAYEIVEWIMCGSAMDDRVVSTIVERSDGIPLFIEEIARMVLSRGMDESEATAVPIPTTLQDLLVGRIDRLGAAKTVLQRASVIGREFSIDLLAAVHEHDPDHNWLLEQLESTDLVTEMPSLHRLTFAFRHSLIRDAAYSTLVRQERRALHKRVAHALMGSEAGDPADRAATPDVVAYHCAEGGLVAEAIAHYYSAAQLSMASGANAEAVAFVERGLGLVDRIPPGPDRAAAELTLLTTRGPALMAQLGYGHSAVAQTFSRAKELCNELDDPIEIFPGSLWPRRVLGCPGRPRHRVRPGDSPSPVGRSEQRRWADHARSRGEHTDSFSPGRVSARFRERAFVCRASRLGWPGKVSNHIRRGSWRHLSRRRVMASVATRST